MINVNLITERESSDKKYKIFEYEIGNQIGMYRFIKGVREGYVSFELYRNREPENYLPDIYYSDLSLLGGKTEFTIQTTSYGALPVEEIEEVIKGYQLAAEIVEYLNKHLEELRAA